MTVDLEPCDCDDKCGHFNLNVQGKWFSISTPEAQNLSRMLRDNLEKPHPLACISHEGHPCNCMEGSQ